MTAEEFFKNTVVGVDDMDEEMFTANQLIEFAETYYEQKRIENICNKTELLSMGRHKQEEVKVNGKVYRKVYILK